MKTLIRIVLLISCVGTMASSQSADSSAHTFGLRFFFNGLYISGGLGAKLWISDVSAVALDLSASVSSQSGTDYSNKERSINATSHYEHHFRFNKNATFFVVGSPSVGFSTSSSSYPSDNYFSEYWILGFRFGLGAEYWVNDNISLSTIQSVGYAYRFHTDRNHNSSILSAQAIGLFLTVYF